MENQSRFKTTNHEVKSRLQLRKPAAVSGHARSIRALGLYNPAIAHLR
jgi:hypothetical protein